MKVTWSSEMDKRHRCMLLNWRCWGEEVAVRFKKNISCMAPIVAILGTSILVAFLAIDYPVLRFPV